MKKKAVIWLIVILLLILINRKSEAEQITTTEFKTSQAVVSRVNGYDALILKASYDFNIPESRIKAHIAVESGGDPLAAGSAGEVGLMQMRQAALTDVNNKHTADAPFLLTDLLEPKYAIPCGTAYLRMLYDQLGTLDKASIAYNTGAGNINIAAGQVYLNKIKAYELLF